MINHFVRDSTPEGRRTMVSESNLNPILQMITWLLLAIMSLMLCFRQLTRCFIKASKSFSWEDLLVLVSFAFALGESVSSVIPESKIYGTEISMISPEELSEGNKAGLARDLLLILSLGFSKLSVYLNLIALSPNATHRRMTHSLGCLVAFWMITSLIGTGFQHANIRSWNPNNGDGYFGQKEFLTYVAVINIVTDFALMVIPILIISPLHMAFTFRVALVSFYAARILVIITTICQLVYLPRLLEDDDTLLSFPYYLCSQLVQFTSFSATCIVYFWPLLRSLQSGLMAANTNTTFTAQFPLMKLSRQTLDKSQSIGGTTVSQNQDRKDYVEITTDIAVSRGGHGTQSLPTAERYNFTWER
ncbi:hypothetical protein F5B20DRAFT_541531 [Whalleya microplaca]|nr:hypothetical protein F5B20DRAFT_541531 [Whalleya microplaca]